MNSLVILLILNSLSYSYQGPLQITISTIPIKVEQLTATLFWDKITFSSPSNVTLDEFIQKELKELLIELYKSDKLVLSKGYPYNQNNKALQITATEPFQNFTFKIGYTLNNEKSYTFSEPNYKFFSCFGAPETPTDLAAVPSKDCKNIEFTWQPPKVINAPRICNYSFKIDNSRLMYSSEPKYIYSNPSFDRTYTIRIEAINSASCYTYYQECSGSAATSPALERAIAIGKCTVDPGNSASSVIGSSVNSLLKFLIISIFIQKIL